MELFSLDLDIESLLFLIQFKYTQDPSSDKEDQLKFEDTPLAWYQSLHEIEKMKEMKGFHVVYVYITNANIPKKSFEAIEVCQRLIIIEQSNASLFFSPNMYPYFASVESEGDKQEGIIEAGIEDSMETEILEGDREGEEKDAGKEGKVELKPIILGEPISPEKPGKIRKDRDEEDKSDKKIKTK
jgi:hypothetical protein